MAGAQLAAPRDLMYESPNLAGVRLLRDGVSPYDPEVYAGERFTLTPYTPLWFELAARLPEAPSRPFLPARVLSLLCTLASAAVVARFARGVTAALAAAGAFLLVWPVTAYAAYLRMDTLAVALSALSMLALRRPTPARVSAAAVLAVLAVATKQTYAAAALGGALFLLARDRRLLLRFVLTGLASGAALAAYATWRWGEGFWFSVFVLRSSPVTLATFWAQAALQLRAPLLLLLIAAAASSALGLLRAPRGTRAQALASSPALAYLAASLAVLLLTLGKEGSSDVYFVEPALALAMVLAERLGRAEASPRARVGWLGALALVAVAELATGPGHRRSFAFPEQAGPDYHAAVRQGLARAGYPSPRLLHLAPPRHAYGFADDVCMNDVSTYDQAFEQGALDPAPLEAAIRARAYDVVVVSALATPERLAGRPTAGAIAAVRETYRLLWADAVAEFYGR